MRRSSPSAESISACPSRVPEKRSTASKRRFPVSSSAPASRLPNLVEEHIDTPPVEESPSSVSAEATEAADRAFHASVAQLTGGLSPAAVALAFADWQLHLLSSPAKCASLAGKAIQHATEFVNALTRKHAMFQPWSVIKPPPTD